MLQRKVGNRFDVLAIVLSGDFNINFEDDKNLLLLVFLNETLGLAMFNDRHNDALRGFSKTIFFPLQLP